MRLWAICALGVLGLGIPFRAISTKLDLTISNRLRSRLFERLLRQGPEFYHIHDPGELNAVANQFTIEAAMTMRQIAVDMLLQMAVLGGTVGLIIYNFQMKGPPPTLFGTEIPPALIPSGHRPLRLHLSVHHRKDVRPSTQCFERHAGENARPQQSGHRRDAIAGGNPNDGGGADFLGKT